MTSTPASARPPQPSDSRPLLNSPPLRSAFFVGAVEHERVKPVPHLLSYRLYMVLVNLDELPLLDREHWWFGYNRRSVLSLFDSDYLDGTRRPLKEKVAERLRNEGIDIPLGPVYLLTAPRLLRPVFNPVSFYYVFSPEGTLLAHLAEVNNTFGERHLYPLTAAHRRNDVNAAGAAYERAKEFHVSPFNDMKGRYEFWFSDLPDGSQVSPACEIRLNVRRSRSEPLLKAVREKHSGSSGQYSTQAGASESSLSNRQDWTTHDRQSSMSPHETGTPGMMTLSTLGASGAGASAAAAAQPSAASEFVAVEDGERFFRTRLKGTLEPFSTRDALRIPFKAPLLSPVLSYTRILWEAGLLYYRKQLPVFRKPKPESAHTIHGPVPRLRHRLALRALEPLFTRLALRGSLTLNMPDRSLRVLEGKEKGFDAVIDVKHYDFFSYLAWRGPVGLGEAFVDSLWESPDPTAAVAFLAHNKEHFEQHYSSASTVLRIVDRMRHLLHRNSPVQAKHNIQAHYDLGNSFYQLFLDPSMLYSSAVFESPEATLEDAQRSKLDRLFAKLSLKPGETLLEIGSGWGTLAIEAAKRFGCSVTTLTLSEEQLRYTEERIHAEGLEDRVKVLLCDYRHITGTFDKIVSIEMLEAVGREYFPSYFQTLEQRLKPDGWAVIQVITVPDYRFERYRRSCDWIQKYIFPGCLLPSLAALTEAMSGHSKFFVAHLEDIGVHYAPTLAEWRRRFLTNWDRIEALGFDARFKRLWLFYLHYCEAGFLTRTLSDVQLVLTRAEINGFPGVPLPERRPSGDGQYPS